MAEQKDTEIKRFLASINFTSNALDEAEIKKVVLNKKTASFEVYLKVNFSLF